MNWIKCAATIFLISFYFQVLDCVLIDCTKKEDIVKLRTQIKNEVLNKATFPSIEQTLPRSYYEVEKDIKELQKNGDIAEHGQYFLFFLITMFGVFVLKFLNSEICTYNQELWVKAPSCMNWRTDMLHWTRTNLS